MEKKAKSALFDVFVFVSVFLIVPSFLYLGYRALGGWPSTPMTVARAEQLFGKELGTGRTFDEAKQWLHSHGISAENGSNKAYYRSDPFREGTSETHWTLLFQNQNPAERAGLKSEDVYAFIDVVYPESDRWILGFTIIHVFLFFDKNGRLMHQWVYEAHMGP